jgi:protein KRI1
MVTDTDLLKRFYGDESQLDSTDKFLRNYILLQCWKDKGGNAKSKLQEQIDQEDEIRDKEMEEFEEKYNFRFEEGTGAYITTHQREVEDTMRRKDDKRKEQRLEKKERIEEEKRKKQEELNKLK